MDNPNAMPIIPPQIPGQAQAAAGIAANNLIVNMQQQQAEQRQQMHEALIQLGLSPAAAQEIINNGITSLERLRMLSKDGLERLLKQLHRGIQAGAAAGVFIPFFSQESILSIHFWCNRMHILGIPKSLKI
jgi:hypothetical protein